MDCAMSMEWQSVADQQVAPVDNKPFILDCLHYSLRHNQSIQSQPLQPSDIKNFANQKIWPPKKNWKWKHFSHLKNLPAQNNLTT